jgi:hypothetical protein
MDQGEGGGAGLVCLLLPFFSFSYLLVGSFEEGREGAKG